MFLAISALILIYLAFVDSIEIKLDWKTISVFSAVTIGLAWMVWNVFYRKQYESLMLKDIEQGNENEYSVHVRYYNATKNWDDVALQDAIDKFNDDYLNKWLRYVCKQFGQDKLKRIVTNPETGETKTEEITMEERLDAIKDMPYKSIKGIARKILWLRIKHRRYPESGYRTSMEVLSLLSYNDSNLNKRNLRADRTFYKIKASKKFIMLFMTVAMGASLIPDMINGNWWGTLLKLVIALFALATSSFFGAFDGVRGARKKIALVEDTCQDLERWAKIKPIVEPYQVKKVEQMEMNLSTTESTQLEVQPSQISMDIFATPANSG